MHVWPPDEAVEWHMDGALIFMFIYVHDAYSHAETYEAHGHYTDALSVISYANECVYVLIDGGSRRTATLLQFADSMSSTSS
jgi:hypothetical protein